MATHASAVLLFDAQQAPVVARFDGDASYPSPDIKSSTVRKLEFLAGTGHHLFDDCGHNLSFRNRDDVNKMLSHGPRNEARIFEHLSNQQCVKYVMM